MRGRALFVTGTDTEVGKTWVSSQLCQAWTRRGLRVAALKAAESGCQSGPSGMVGADDDVLYRSAGGWQPERCRFLFRPAIAPGVAADDLGTSIDFEVIGKQVVGLRQVADLVLVEGAGGWLVPMGAGRTIEDLAKALALPVVIVARAGLGTINHAALTVRAVLDAGLDPVAVVMSLRPEDDRAFALRNRSEIERIVDVPVIPMDEPLVDVAAVRLDGLLA